jgi:hypothetical protein
VTVFTPSTIAAIIAASFAAGLNVYATVLTLGLLAHTHWVVLPAGPEILGNWGVIAVSGTLFAAILSPRHEGKIRRERPTGPGPQQREYELENQWSRSFGTQQRLSSR